MSSLHNRALCSFVAAFAQEDANRIEGPSGVLYLGKLPPRAGGEYFAIIPVRPPAGSMVRVVACSMRMRPTPLRT